MTNNEHDGMKKCTKCGEWKPATAEYFNRDKTATCGLRSWCKECRRDGASEHYQKNKDRIQERRREYRQKNKDKVAERNREYYQKNKDREREYSREYAQTPAGRLSGSIKRLRQKTGATIYLRDMTEEQKETLANQYVAVRTLEKTEKELLAASGKKRCSKCDRVLDYGCFNKNTTKTDGVCVWCRECNTASGRVYRKKNKDKIAESDREYRQQNKDKINEYRQQNKDKNKDYYREYYQQNKDEINERRRQANKKNKKKHLTK